MLKQKSPLDDKLFFLVNNIRSGLLGGTKGSINILKYQQKKIMRLILKDGFWYVHIQCISMVTNIVLFITVKSTSDRTGVSSWCNG